MNVVVAYHRGDRERAVEWLEHVKKLGALKNHTLYLIPAFDCPPIPEIIPFVGLTDYLRVSSDWRSADGVRHANASGPNSMLVQAARYFYDNKLGAFFWCEVDCVVLKPHSFDKLEEEYLACGKPYLGGFAPAPVPHINGNAIYPENAALLPTLMLPMKSLDGTRDIAFDVAAAREILPQAHKTELIQHLWRGPSFTSQEDFDARIRKDALFYHQCRDGSIYKYLNHAVVPAEVPDGFHLSQDGKVFIGNDWEEVPPAQISDVTKAPEQTGNGLTNEILEQVHSDITESSVPTQYCPSCKQPVFGRASGPCLECCLVKARAALAAKRATGWKPGKRKVKRTKRRVRRLHAKA